ncbi:MAG: type III-A CRISPR-associated protein Csm2 [Thermodesulfobacteriota bacterium]|nr:type III-A CRISPR-associated protein Csm2 [Thermodesulfobacteriota bacterium]
MVQPNRNSGYKPHGQQGAGRPSYGGQSPTAQLPTPVPLNYYSDPDKKQPRADLLDDYAREIADRLVPIKNKDDKENLKATQMRRFYDELKAIERKIMSGKDLQEQQANFERDRALIVMFKAKAVYAEKRKVAPRAFTQFIFDHVASIKDLADFKGFLKVFEAVVAFHKFYSPEK